MMNIWIRSIARAGGVEMPSSARVVETRAEQGAAGFRPALAKALRRVGALLMRTGDRVCGEANAAVGRC